MRAWVEIDINNLRQNIRNIQAHLNKNTKFMGIIKADGYGHGATRIAHILRDEGVLRFGVATVDEGISLRENGFDEDILLLGYTAEEDYIKVAKYGLIATIYSVNQAEVLNREAHHRNKRVKIHIKLDTGMNRLGFQCNETTVNCIKYISKLKNIEIEGIFTHLATADYMDSTYARLQFNQFIHIINKIALIGVKIPIKHAANSAATLKYREMHLDMVRVGISIYGLYPSTDMANDRFVQLSPIMSIKSRIAHVKWVEKGDCIGYGADYIVTHGMKLGTVTVGYADGIFRTLSNKGHALVNGVKCPIVGKVCMDQFMVDITAVSEIVQQGDQVVIMGSSGSSKICADDIAEDASTILYEVVSRIGKRLPRININETII